MKINNFRGELPDISAKKEALEGASAGSCSEGARIASSAMLWAETIADTRRSSCRKAGARLEK